ncbi:adenylate/guanylate cyclase domain-containing protein [[Phormidium] sp. ETS-05]|uniref:adenylate/guanylate cyclase domain-containing protein n=1 Tax=[Phormidium] sp. ETS-05 TaxID=222819 RepID=UPI001E5969B6|nr:adenylate/guanylate cyclase domain-containing protein [[Phormidium] sp. ETS-05]
MTENPAESSKGNILIVDDTPVNLRLLSTMLKKSGYEVRGVLNGAMALMGAKAKPPDLILLDINMPEMNGYEVCQRLKEMEETRDIPIIFISALGDVLDKVKAFQVGGVDYIGKPFQFEEVLARLENQLTLRRLQKQTQEQNDRLQQEIKERKRAEEKIRLLLTMTQAINEAPDFDAALEVALTKVCDATGWQYGEAWIPTADKTALQCNPSWYCRSEEIAPEFQEKIEEFRAYSEGLILLPDEELPGRIWVTQEPEWICDFSAQDNDALLRVELAKECGIKAGFGVPIFMPEGGEPVLHESLRNHGEPESAGRNDKRDLLAVLVFFMLESRPRDRHLVDLVSAVAAQLGTAIQQKQTEAELRALFAAMNDVIFAIDSQGYYLKIAPTNPELLYKPSSELLGKTLYEVFDRQIADTFIGYIWDALNSQKPVNIEYNLNIKGQEVVFAATISPISDDSVIWMARDITERKRAEEARREAEEKYRSIFENAAEGIYQTTPQGQYISANPAMARIYGYASAEELMVKLTDIGRQLYVNPNRRDDFVAALEVDDSLANFEAQVYRKDGSIIWISENARAVRNAAGQLIFYEGIVEDITQRKLAEEALRAEQEKSERLLLNILPSAIADQLKHDQSVTPMQFDEATIVFADIVNFTPMSARMSATELVSALNEIFSTFDHLADKHGVEKIKTLGDAYMVAGGLPVPRADHAEAIADMTLDMLDNISKFHTNTGEQFQIRIGVNTGPVVAGVIGIKKFIYDLWGDTVNTASRMESHGLPGAIQVTEATYQKLKHRYHLAKRGIIDVKGKGPMTTYWLEGRKE